MSLLPQDTDPTVGEIVSRVGYAYFSETFRHLTFNILAGRVPRHKEKRRELQTSCAAVFQSRMLTMLRETKQKLQGLRSPMKTGKVRGEKRGRGGETLVIKELLVSKIFLLQTFTSIP